MIFSRCNDSVLKKVAEAFITIELKCNLLNNFEDKVHKETKSRDGNLLIAIDLRSEKPG